MQYSFSLILLWQFCFSASQQYQIKPKTLARHYFTKAFYQNLFSDFVTYQVILNLLLTHGLFCTLLQKEKCWFLLSIAIYKNHVESDSYFVSIQHFFSMKGDPGRQPSPHSPLQSGIIIFLSCITVVMGHKCSKSRCIFGQQVSSSVTNYLGTR